MFSAAAITPTTRRGSLSRAAARRAPKTAAAPDMSCFMSPIPSAGLIEIPPESKAYELYRKYVRRLDPDIVVLTFVSNDLNEFEDLTREELLSYSIETERNSLTNWLVSYTALGETVLDLSLRLRFEGYSSASVELIGDPRRYVIARNTQ